MSQPPSKSPIIKLNATAMKNKMIDFSTLNGLNSCNSMFSISESEDDYFFVMNTNVKITIKSSFNEGSFEIKQPGHVIIAREGEMKQTAKIMNSDWKGSLVMQRLLKQKQKDTSSSNGERCSKRRSKEVAIEILTTEYEYNALNWSSAFRRSIEHFYKTGVISIHNDSAGRDMVLALKFLKLIYTPNQLMFESFGTYLKFKLWSDYIVCRKDIVMWVKNCLVQNYSQHKYMFVTHPVLLTNATFYCHGQRCEQLNGGLQRYFTNPGSSFTGKLPML